MAHRKGNPENIRAALFQKVWLKGFLEDDIKSSPMTAGSAKTALDRALTSIHTRLNGLNNKDVFTQDWMRSALFLRYVAMRGGNEALDTVMSAVWAYTAALIDGITRICSNPDILDWVPKEQKYSVHLSMLQAMKKALNVQMGLMKDMHAAKAQYDQDADARNLGKTLLHVVHCPDHMDTDREFRAFVDALIRLGPEGLPPTDWDMAVCISKAILQYVRRTKA